MTSEQETVAKLVDEAVRSKGTGVFGNTYVLNGEIVSKSEFARASGMAHMLGLVQSGPAEMALPLDIQKLYRPLFWSFSKLDPFKRPLISAVRVRTLALLVRLMLALGYVVFLVGRTCTGKTFLLKHVAPGNIIDGCIEPLRSGRATDFSASSVSEGIIAIDEVQGFERTSLMTGVRSLSARSLIITGQTIDHAERMGLCSMLHAVGRRTLVLELK